MRSRTETKEKAKVSKEEKIIKNKSPHNKNHSHQLKNWDYKRLLHYAELETWRQDNPWILTGYRTLNYSYFRCFQTLSFIHNETGNILSHFLGGLVFVFLSYYTYGYVIPASGCHWVWELSVKLGILTGWIESHHPLHPDHSDGGHVYACNWGDLVIFTFFLLGAIGCMWMSALFHLFLCHSKPVVDSWNKCDYVGIMTLIVGSTYPCVYYGFDCNPILQWIYLGSISTFGLSSIPLLIMDNFNTAKYRIIRTLLFVAMGLSAIVPMAHAVFLYGWYVVLKASSLDLVISMGAFYLVGAFLYAKQFPECAFPGKFDIWFNSHQIFHLCVVAAAIIHYIGLIKSYNWHKENECYGFNDIDLNSPSLLNHLPHHHLNASLIP